MRGILILFSFYFLQFALKAQTKYPVNYFRAPVDGRITIAGNFGQLRPDHFHAGIDIRTGGKEGTKVLAAADGYISRIKISPYGYGKAIYITHPNGFVTVYGHLKEFNKTIEKYVKKRQYELETFEIELKPGPDKLPVFKGDLIALSGNTGTSEAPHLHFEIRDEKTEYPINPLFFGILPEDTVKPVIKSITVYPLNKESTVDGKNNSKNISFSVKQVKSICLPINEDTISAEGKIGLGIEAYDAENGTKNNNQVYSLELYDNAQLIYSFSMDKFSFDETRYINCHIDYAEKINHNRRIQRSYLLENNKLSIYKSVENRGIINVQKNEQHKLKYIVKDFYGNTDSLKFKITGTDQSVLPNSDTLSGYRHFECTRQNRIFTSDLFADFPENTFYEDIDFYYLETADTLNQALSPVHILHNNLVPLHYDYNLKIRCRPILASLESKALIVSLNKKNQRIPVGGKWENGFVSAQTTSLGNFEISLDTISPVIKPVNIVKGKLKSGAKEIQVRITDDLSGIKTYRGVLDGKWILMEYEPKKNLLFYKFQEPLKPGKHTLDLEVTDERSNTRNLKKSFIK